ncbi:Gfo/Idh/MocA family protein [Paenibacillus sp. IITD108]|uniref:Gfo/Idh/MocA family protein n=1 Tax=Paenibacillus sp. IITD108 TaxID=3116649 RepID=UPI002F4299F9
MGYTVAVVGAGGISAQHFEACQMMDQLQAVAVADLSQERANDVAQRYGIKPYTDYKQMLEVEKPDIAVITLPHFLHKEAALFAASQGCHILLEKPMAMNAAECDDIIEAVKAAGVKLMIGHTQHYIPENLAAKAIIDSGELGQLVMIQDTRHVNYYADKRPAWFFEKNKAGGGIFMNLGSHSIDKIQLLTGSRIVEAKASVSYYGSKGDIEGSGIAWVRTKSGIPATICQSGYKGASKNETEIIFTDGKLKLLTSESLWISKDQKYEEVTVDRSTPPFVLQFNDLIRYIEEGIAPSASMEYSRSIIAVVEAMYRSEETSHDQAIAD